MCECVGNDEDFGVSLGVSASGTPVDSLCELTAAAEDEGSLGSCGLPLNLGPAGVERGGQWTSVAPNRLPAAHPVGVVVLARRGEAKERAHIKGLRRATMTTTTLKTTTTTTEGRGNGSEAPASRSIHLWRFPLPSARRSFQIIGDGEEERTGTHTHTHARPMEFTCRLHLSSSSSSHKNAGLFPHSSPPLTFFIVRRSHYSAQTLPSPHTNTPWQTRSPGSWPQRPSSRTSLFLSRSSPPSPSLSLSP